MKKLILGVICCTLFLGITGCTSDTESKNDKGEQTREFSVGEVATVDKNTTVKINEVKKVEKECNWEYDNKCQSYTNPENDFFLIIDLTIENKGSEDLNISSMLSFDLKDASGEKGKYALLTKSIKSQLDGTIMPNDLLKGQIGYDVKDSEKYTFYYKNDLISNPIKFIINKTDIK